MVLEGLGRSLDPNLDILEIAKPLLLKNLLWCTLQRHVNVYLSAPDANTSLLLKSGSLPSLRGQTTDLGAFPCTWLKCSWINNMSCHIRIGLNQRFSIPVLAPPPLCIFCMSLFVNTPDSDNQLVRSALRAWTVFRLTCSLHRVHCSLHRVHCSLHSVHCSLHRVHCSLHRVHCSLHRVHCSLHRVHCSLHRVHCSLHRVHCSLHRVHCSLHRVHCSLHSVHCSLHRVHCSLHSVHCSLHRVHCSLHRVHCSLHRVHCSLHSVHCSLHSVHCSLHSVHCSLHSVHCSLHRVHCSLHSVHCSLHSVHCSLHGVHCSLHGVHCSLHGVHCSLHGVHCSLHGVHCSLHRVHCSLHSVHCSLHRVHCSLHRVHCSLHRVHCSLLPEQGNPLKFTSFQNIHSWICATQRLHARTSVTSYTSVNIYNFNSRLAHFSALWMEYIRSLRAGIMEEYPDVHFAGHLRSNRTNIWSDKSNIRNMQSGGARGLELRTSGLNTWGQIQSFCVYTVQYVK